jgi:uncharacterized integral membrane protein (TIGR00697 family)
MPAHLYTNLTTKKQYKYPFILLGLYLTFLLATVCLAGKLTLIKDLLLPGGIFAFPLTFVICDIVGEVYGYAYPRLFIWIGIAAELFFSIIVIIVSHLASPEYFKDASAYPVVFDPTLRYVVSGLSGLLVGEFVNVYLLAKWKILFKGKLFVLRSLISTALGQASLTIIVDVLNYTGKIPFLELIHMMYAGYFWKILFAVILVFPAWLIVKYLKKSEQIDYYDFNTNFNPFKVSLNNSFDAPVRA